jgi:hypothetical protein
MSVIVTVVMTMLLVVSMLLVVVAHLADEDRG